MKELSEDEVQLVVKALEHYSAYLVARQREDRRYQELAQRLPRRGARQRGSGASDQEEAGITLRPLPGLTFLVCYQLISWHRKTN
jgi:hypothetical protein